jgi:succinate dehydrogenase/fumarate reductase flavoprotein subunit
MAAAGMLGGCGSSGQTTPEATAAQGQPTGAAAPWLPAEWHDEADVIVVGTGFAGQAAAITAHDAGADVLVIEKSTEALQGGNSRVCGQGFIAPPENIWDDYFTYLKALTAGLGFPVFPDEAASDETIRFYIEESSKSIKWFEDMGAYVMDDSEAMGGAAKGLFPFFPHMPGAEVVASAPGFYMIGGEYAGPGANWYFLEDQILERGIRKLYETPMTGLVQDPITKEILGVIALREGKDYYIKAKKAVCVCAGGFEYNQQMQRDFQGIANNWSPGTPFNTGETIKVCWAAGADIRNMGNRNAPVYPMDFSIGPKAPYLSAPVVTPKVVAGGAIVVGANNKRFRDEYKSWTTTAGIHNREKSGLDGVVIFNGRVIEDGVYTHEKTPQPMHLIFDEAARLSGPLFSGCFSVQVEGYAPSADNSTELEAGWIIKADSIEELVEKLGRQPDPLFGKVPLQETIDHWNEMCAAGVDEDLGRTGNLTPLEGPPYYAVQLFPNCVNTQGGMVRNTKGQVLDIHGQVIPRLYSAGENGDIWTIVYQCMSNVGGGCYGYGRSAGANAAAEEPWA